MKLCRLLASALAVALSASCISIPVSYAESTDSPVISGAGEKQEFNGHTYQRFDATSETTFMWREANKFCQEQGGHLVTITSAEEQTFIESLLSDGNMDVYWIGATVYALEFKWVTGEETSYTNWAKGQPDNAYEGYHVEIHRIRLPSGPAYSWGDTDDDGEFFGLDKTGFICEWDSSIDTSTSLLGEGTEKNPYQLGTLEDYKKFVNIVNSGANTSACAVMTADISGVTEMVGTLDHEYLGSGDWNGNSYSGIFDGAGHTLDVKIEGSGGYEAPFCNVNNATIRNLKVTGTITGGMHCSGMVGLIWDKSINTIENSVVAATITTTSSHCGGIVGHAYTSDTTVSNCLFSGEIKGATSTACGIYGWCHFSGTHTVSNCLENGTYTECSGIDPLGHGIGVTVNIINSYKYTDVGDTGSVVGEMTPDELAAVLGSGWKVEDSKVVPIVIYSTYPAYTLGDVNDDEKIDAVDASSVLTYYANISTNKDGEFNDEQKLSANVNNDEKIDAVDASCILSYYAYTSTTKEDIISIEEYVKKK
ncbi:lectin-like protein [Ruminococcus flavefaciens]|uniref:lectin-like protein n=1 Tax=Ruminococcus flavefaciens TaxID=1265 RepID=UPI0026F277C4|nr:lectin-like protein [Ruminococcus flavefaciens]MDD7516461.1 lectin-like protein [Ruminococcus flavefaciens]MDY5690928.1 lectin-like protein [Ruminococcus flavefaciens]